MLAKKGDCPVKACKVFFSLPPRYFINNDQTCNLLFELWEISQWLIFPLGFKNIHFPVLFFKISLGFCHYSYIYRTISYLFRSSTVGLACYIIISACYFVTTVSVQIFSVIN